ncbi:MAG: alpha/beta hydrolase [Gammaproteobacteria bacterium]|nr:alpha/beta hydrolase [Gammaproteobacteria bacterium]
MTTLPEHSDEMQPAPSTDRTVSVSGLRLHYLDFALGPASETPPGEDPRPKMVCIHGGAAHAHWFDFVASAFTEQFRVLSLDLRGHGDSEWAKESDYTYQRYAADVAEFVETLAIGPVALVGHSMGGMVSLVTAASYPEHIETLVVIDSMMQMTPERASTLRGIGEGKGRSFDTREAFIAGFKIRPAGTSAEPHIVRHMAQHSCRADDAGQWRNKFDRNVYAKRHPIDGFDYWSRVRAPALLVAGGASDRITPQVLARVRASCPHVSLHTVPDAGHHVTLDNPAGYRAGVSEFFRAIA